ncbi:MAG: vWA domain-containing protein [Motilibacteraceae bacterium]
MAQQQGKRPSVVADAVLSDAQRARARTKVQAGRARAIHRHPYLAIPLSRMVLVESDQVSSYAVDARWRVYYNPRVVLAEPIAECEASWVHEVSHRLRAHDDRFRALGEPWWRARIFNYAADAFINTDLIELGLAVGASWRLTLDGLPVPAERRESTEEVYRRLHEHLRRQMEALPDESTLPADDVAAVEEQAIGQELGEVDCGSGAAGGKRPWDLADEDTDDGSVDDGSAELIRQDTAQKMLQHARQHGRGSVPRGMFRWAESLLDPRVDWRAELRATLSRAFAPRLGLQDYSYDRPSSRSPSPWVVLPGMVEKPPPAAAWVQDTSGSMDQDDLRASLAEAKGVLRRVSRGGRRLQVIACDSSPAEAQTISSVGDIVLVGGGGTDMRAGLRAAAGLRPRVDVVVVATDGETPWPDRPPVENPSARYIALLVRGDAPHHEVPRWMRKVVIDG